jgi:hypothetical protein
MKHCIYDLGQIVGDWKLGAYKKITLKLTKQYEFQRNILNDL